MHCHGRLLISGVWTYWLYIPHSIGEIQFSVKLLQGKCMDLGLVQEKGIANTSKFIMWEEVAVCCNLDVVNVGNLSFRDIEEF